jgi:dihydrolipoamide dehydrogenase
MSEIYDLAIIGGGPGGYSAALRARQLGLTVVLAEKERVGGVCLNRGCIPTKALLSDLEGLRWMHRAAKEGIIDHVPTLKFSSLMRRKAAVVDTLVGNLEKLLVSKDIVIMSGRARITEPGSIELKIGEAIRARNTVIATGSRSWVPPIPGKDLPRVITTRDILNLEKLPQRLVIIGGGIIGQEFAAIFSGLGTSVTVLEALPRILLEVDSDIAKRYSALLPGRGVMTETSAKVLLIEEVGDLLRLVYE